MTMSRRKLLQAAGVGAAAALANPLDMLIEALLAGSYGDALAAAVGVMPRNYVHFQQLGAPSRWGADLFLTPFGRVGFQDINASIVNRYVAVNGVYTDAVYDTVSRAGINVPPVWAAKIPRADGTWGMMSDLLANLLTVRGIRVGNVDHTGASIAYLTPLGARTSLAAMSAQASDRPIPAVHSRVQGFQFNNIRGLSAVASTNFAQPLEELMAPFRGASPASMKANLTALKDVLGQAEKRLAERARAANVSSDVIVAANKGAAELLERSYVDLSTTYSALLAKYQNLIRRSFNILGDTDAVIPGVTDLPIGIPTAGRTLHYQNSNLNEILQIDDARRLFGVNADLTAAARAFAIAEYVLLNRLSSSVTLGIGQLSGLAEVGRSLAIVYDEHFLGRMLAPLTTAMWCRAMGACIYELTRAMGPDMFKETIIHCRSEFGRSPLASGAGSDHADDATVMALYSGAINGPYVVGDISRGSSAGNYPGTYGVGASGFGLGTMASTLAACLRVPSPVTVEGSIVVDDGTEIRPIVAPGTIV